MAAECQDYRYPQVNSLPLVHWRCEQLSVHNTVLHRLTRFPLTGNNPFYLKNPRVVNASITSRTARVVARQVQLPYLLFLSEVFGEVATQLHCYLRTLAPTTIISASHVRRADNQVPNPTMPVTRYEKYLNTPHSPKYVKEYSLEYDGDDAFPR
jgi:hypothetical protein